MKKLIVFCLTVFLCVISNQDVKASTIKELTPLRNIDSRHDFTIQFSSSVNEETVLSSNIYIEDYRGVIMEPKLAITAGKDAVKVYAPDKGYDFGETYTIVVTPQVKDVKGNVLSKKTTMKFTIQNRPVDHAKMIDFSLLKQQKLMDIQTGGMNPLHHAQYKVEDQFLKNNPEIMYYYTELREDSAAGKTLRMSVANPVPKHISNVSYRVDMPEDKDYLDRYITIVYLDKDLNPVAYQEEQKRLLKAAVHYSSSVKEMETSQVGKYIYLSKDKDLSFIGQDYYSEFGASYFSFHYNNQELNFVDELKRKDRAALSAEITNVNGRSIPPYSLKLDENTEYIYAMIVFYDKDYNVMSYGKRKFEKKDFE